MNRIKQILVSVRESLWFVPTLMVLAAIAAAVVLIEANAVLQQEWLETFPRVFGAGADGSRGMLTAIAGSMITVATLAFSLTIVAMSQVASLYSSRVLRNFIRDRRNQFVLGYFVSVFAYCLVVLRTIRGGDEGAFIPSIAVFVGLLLAVASIAVLIFFIHHIADSIQASAIIANAAEETRAAVRRLFPTHMGEEAEPPSEDEWGDDISGWCPVPAPSTGFIEAVDEAALLGLARSNDCTIRMERGIGDFISEGSPVVLVSVRLGDEEMERIGGTFTVGRYRTLEQDAAFGIRQLVDIALRALSPGINDTTTAAICVDHLGSILAELVDRKVEGKFRKDDAGVIRVIARGATFSSLVDEAFDQIRDSASNNPMIFLRQLDAIQVIGGRTDNGWRLENLADKVSLIESESKRTLEAEYNLTIVQQRVDIVKKFLMERKAQSLGAHGSR